MKVSSCRFLSFVAGIRHSCWERQVTWMSEVGLVVSGGNRAPWPHREPLCELGIGAPSSPWKPTGPALISAILEPLSRHYLPNQMPWPARPEAVHAQLKAMFVMQGCGPSLLTASDLLFCFFCFFSKIYWRSNFCVWNILVLKWKLQLQFRFP